MRRAGGLLLFFLIVIGTCFSAAASEADTDEMADSYLDELDLEEIQDSIREMFPDTSFDFRESVGKLMKGETPLDLNSVRELLRDAVFGEVASQRDLVVQILVLAVAAAVFSNFVRVFEKNQISDVAFYMIYLLLFVILMRAFAQLNLMAQNYLGQILHFMRILLPAYLIVASLAAGSVTAVGFYELTLVIIGAVQVVLNYVVLPAIRFYVLFLLLNYLGKEDYFSKLADLVKLALGWTLKTMLALVIGVQTVQALLLPAIDSLKNSVWKRAAGALPVLGSTLNAVTETVLGTAVLLKSAVGAAGMTVIVLICLTPIARLLICTFLYKAVGAAVQPVSDRRITECISGVGEGAALLLKTMAITGVMFLLTLAMVTASIRGV